MKNLSDELMRWAIKSQDSRRMGVIARHAAPYMTVNPSDLDRRVELLNVKNGTLVIRKTDDGTPYVRLKPHDPQDLMTKVCDVEYDPKATCPTYDAALARLQPDPEVRAFLHRAIGYALCGGGIEQKFLFFIGEGRNGKSTIVDLWASILGDYSASISIETFMDNQYGRNGGQATPHLARLAGVRLLRTSEPEKGSKMAETVIKQITSNEPISVRHLNRDFFELYPLFMLIISGNYRLQIRGTDDGIWRRVVLVPWRVKLTDAECDPRIADKLRAEASGVLNRLLDGACEWLDHGLQIPASILAATAEYRSSSDLFAQFVAECIRVSPGQRVGSRALYNLYVAWAKATGNTIWSQTGVGKAMRDRGYDNIKSGSHFWLDIELIKSEADFDDDRSDGHQNASGHDVDGDEVPL